MEYRWIVLPAALLALYTLIFMLLMAGRRIKAAKSGRVDPKYFKLYRGSELPEDLQLWNRHFNNLLETPIVFYFAVTIAVLTQQVTTFTVALSWVYLISRLLHSWIHLNGNRIQNRFKIFGLGIMTLVVFWITLIVGMFI